VNEELVRRVLTHAPEVLEGIRNGVYRVYGGVIRVAKGHDGAGRIIGHLQFPDGEQQTRESIEKLQQVLGDQLGSIEMLQTANLALSGLNLAVSAAGFVVVCNKLNGISSQLDSQAETLNELKAYAVEASAIDQLRDTARFRSTVKVIRQFDEMEDLDGLKSQIPGLHEQYEVTRLMLERLASGATSQGFLDSLPLQKQLQERLMYLACMQSYVHQKIGARKFAVEALRELQDDWFSIHSAIVDSIETNKNWVGQLSQQSGAQIVAMLDYRKQAAPGIEYQASLLEFTMERPASFGSLESANDEILFLAA
jgi:hypothetical protein